ncbi:MAG: o-succinylbenzoate synthase [Mastigocoleus sp.]
MQYQFDFRPYRRRFKPPIITSHGTWDIREGVILRLVDQLGNIGFGEIAPIAWFGSESIEQALEFCHQLSTKINHKDEIFKIPNDLPATQFGFESAWKNVTEKCSLHKANDSSSSHSFTYSGLLGVGETALQQSKHLWEQGYRTFKWKIGVHPIGSELNIFKQLTQILPSRAKIRLDANGGLNYDDANLWMWTCDNLAANSENSPEIEFIEQPLPKESFSQMLELSFCYGTKIALDESVANLEQLKYCYEEGWREIFVIKPGIAGSPTRLRQFCQEHKLDVVFSSVFETSVGRKAALQLASEIYNSSQSQRAVGFGVKHCFSDDEEQNWLNNLW